MKYAFYFAGLFLSAVAVFSFAAPASANVSGLSTDPSYAADPFTFYCSPYTESFEEDAHYAPQDGPCVYSVPSSITGQRGVRLYRGTVGSGTFLTGGTISGFTLVQDDFVPFSFFNTQPDEPFFAVVYDFGELGNNLHPYLTGTGPLPENAVLNDNFYVLPWRWEIPTPPDTTPPAVEITSPEDGETYTTEEEILPAATITDESAIETTTYLFNDSEVNPGEPLPFNSAPLGLNTLEVVAIDEFGNEGSDEISFTLEVPPPPDTEAPLITILNPERWSVHAREDEVFIEVDITDDSPIAEVEYFFDNEEVDENDELPLSSAKVGKHTVRVTATDEAGNSATETVPFIVVKDKNSCVLDIVAVLIGIKNNEWPDKPTIAQLIQNCAALAKERAEDRRDDKKHNNYSYHKKDNHKYSSHQWWR